MTAIGIDTHKRTLAACALDGVGRVLGERTFPTDPAGLVALIAWVGEVAPGAIVGVEGSSSYGAPAARALHAAGVDVREVPPHLSRRERPRTRRAGKSDPGDALAIARVTLRETDLPPVRLEDPTEELGLLVDAREELVTAQTRARNRLHAHLVVVLPGYRLTVSRLVAERRLRRGGIGTGGRPGRACRARPRPRGRGPGTGSPGGRAPIADRGARGRTSAARAAGRRSARGRPPHRGHGRCRAFSALPMPSR